MSVLEVLHNTPWLLVTGGVVLGLTVGSFLNVVIHRLPKMLEQQWRADCAELAGASAPAAEKVNLVVPPSACPQCGHRIAALENIPLVSYLALGGRCSACKARISPRYPAVEALCGLLGGYVMWRYGMSWAALWAAVYVWAMIALAVIDQETGYLPDDLTQPLLWLGILVSVNATLGVDLATSIAGAVAGYLSLWVIAKAWGFVRNVEAMGHGDFKLLAAIGAWLGWKAILGAVLISSFLGAVAGVIIMIATGQGMQAKLRFGPYLAVAGVLFLLWGERINKALGLDDVSAELQALFRGLF